MTSSSQTICEADTKKGPLVSIIIDNFNYGRFIARAIDSALQQTYQNIEVIVIDDGSTDNSLAVINSFGDSVTTIVKKNGGQGSAYNVGFHKSRGELLLYLDADDFLDLHAVEKCVQLWRPGVTKIHFYLRVVMGEEESPTDVIIPTSQLAQGYLREETLRCGHHISSPASGNIYARSALQQIVPVPEQEWLIGADTYFIHLTALLGEVRACDTPLGYYRIHGSNWDASRSIDPTILRGRLEKERLRDEMFHRFCVQRNLHYVEGSVANQIGHMKVRLSSLALDPEPHPYPSDRLISLAWKTIRVTWTCRGMVLSKKLFVLGWVAAVVTVPRRFRKRIIEVGLLPIRRMGIVSRSLCPGKPAELLRCEYI